MSNIKEWAIDDRPREKLMNLGASLLSDAELLAIIIGSGNKEETAVGLARQILKSADNDIDKLSNFSIAELSQHKGIGNAKAISIVAALELSKRKKKIDFLEKKFRSSTDVYDFFYPVLGDVKQEEFWVLSVDNSNKYIDKKRIAIGGIGQVYVDIKIIMSFLLKSSCTRFFLCHNHPSGNNNPSEEDKKITKKIKLASELLDIELLDHIIVAKEKYFSFADNELI